MLRLDFSVSDLNLPATRDEVREHIAMFAERRDAVEKMLNESALSDEAKSRYLVRFHDRLRAIAQ